MGKIWENAFHSAVSCFFPAWCQMASPWSASIDRWHASWNKPQALCQQPPCAQALAAALAETMSPRIAWCRVLDAATVAKFIGKLNQVQAWKEHLCDDCFLYPFSMSVTSISRFYEIRCFWWTWWAPDSQGVTVADIPDIPPHLHVVNLWRNLRNPNVDINIINIYPSLSIHLNGSISMWCGFHSLDPRASHCISLSTSIARCQDSDVADPKTEV